MGFPTSTLTSFIGCEPVGLDLGAEPNIGALSGEVIFVRGTDGGLTIDAGCDKHGGNVIHVHTDTAGKVKEVICPSFGGDGKCLLIGDKICPNRIPTSKLTSQD